MRSGQLTEIAVAQDLETIARQVRLGRLTLGETIQLLLGVVANALIDAALMVEAEEGLSDVTP